MAVVEALAGVTDNVANGWVILAATRDVMAEEGMFDRVLLAASMILFVKVCTVAVPTTADGPPTPWIFELAAMCA